VAFDLTSHADRARNGLLDRATTVFDRCAACPVSGELQVRAALLQALDHRAVNCLARMIDGIRDEAERRGESLVEATRAYVLIAIAARVARVCDDLVLRGGLLTRAWIPGHRPARDLDFVGDFLFAIDATRERFARALALDLADGVAIDEDTLSAAGIWLDSEFPGVRLRFAAGFERADDVVFVDVGFRDPLVPPPMTIRLAGTDIRAVRPETQIAWKLHALAEMQASWRPKDLADLWLITRHVALDAALVARAIPPAFESRGFPLASARVLDAPQWATKTARVRWESYRARIGELANVLDDVRAALRAPIEEATR
jgi:hypothetical protein